MNILSFNFLMTEACNFNCSYCYQKKGNVDLNVLTAKRAIEYFFPFLGTECHINFSGGEPTLVFNTVVDVVDDILEKSQKSGKQIEFSLTTNGVLLDDPILQFLNTNKFRVFVSFDGLAQDIGRQQGSFEPVVSVIKKIQAYPDIRLQTSSVFIPETVGYLSGSMRLIHELGVPDILFSLSLTSSWDRSSIERLDNELKSLQKMLIQIHKKTKQIPFTNFRRDSRSGGFYCPAGEDRMSLMPDGRLWGCHLFADYARSLDRTGVFEKYCFGDLNAFIDHFGDRYLEIRPRYSRLNLTPYQTPDRECLQCIEFGECGFCPLETVFSGSDMGMIPGFVCEIKKLLRQAKINFWKTLEN